LNTGEFITITAAIVPEREAVVFENTRLNFEELNDRVNRLANGLTDLGIGSGDRIATMDVNTNAMVEVIFACAKIDAVFLPLNFRAKPEEISFMLNDAEAKAVFAGSRYLDMLDSLRPETKTVDTYIAFEGSKDGWNEYEGTISSSADDEVFGTADDDDLAVLMFTAGTTGTPKGVMLSHNSFSSFILANVEPPDPETEEKNLLTVPLNHIAGLQAVMAAIYGGRTLIIHRQFDPVDWMKSVQNEKADRAMMVPTMLKNLMDHEEFGQYDLSSMKVITYGAAPMPLEVIKKAMIELKGCKFINAFGQTEGAGTITMLSPDDHEIPEGLSEEETEKRFKRLASIGKALPDVEVRIVDEEGNDVPVGESGEIVARGPRLMKGYWNRSEASADTMRGGWLYTGDIAYFDDEGYIFISGRSKDFIKRGGEMIAPEEVEQCLMSHPSVDEAAIIGIQDVTWGERVRAVCVLRGDQEKPSEDDLIEYCRQRMSSFKKPESIVWVSELPRNQMGKVLKNVLREEHSQPIE